MNGAYVSVDTSEMRAFVERMDAAAKGDFRKELETFLDGIGNEFLRIVEEQIIQRNVMDSRLLLNSFHKGSPDGVWIMDVDGLTLEVGTNVPYAKYVNDGHWTNPKGVAERWVPGYWDGDRFVYSRGSGTGMLLKQHWVQGKPYFQAALLALEKMYPKFLDQALQKWLDDYFNF